MNLWIRSQENKAIRNMLLKVDTLELGDFNTKEECIVANNLYCVGIYKNKERALEVLDEIQNILLPKCLIRFDSNTQKIADFLNVGEAYISSTGNSDVRNINNTFVYKMPKE